MTCISCGGHHDQVERVEIDGRDRLRVTERSMCPDELATVLRLRGRFEPSHGPGPWADYLDRAPPPTPSLAELTEAFDAAGMTAAEAGTAIERIDAAGREANDALRAMCQIPPVSAGPWPGVAPAGRASPEQDEAADGTDSGNVS